MTQAIMRIGHLSDEMLSYRPYIRLSKDEVVNGLVELIEAQTEGEEFARFDVTYQGEGFAIRVTGEVRRTYTFRPGLDYDSPSYYAVDAWINVGDYQCYDCAGRKVRSNFSFGWLESLQLGSFS